MQKEGCDGIITSARWLLHRAPQHIRSVCLEFFGQAREAIPAILEIKRYLDTRGKAAGVVLAGLEHLDERYLRAVGYSTKSKRGALPKMILLGDIAGEDSAAVAAATSEVVRLANVRSGEGFIAVSPAARRQFWLDRAKTAAIAKHTNAFKINEDVVIPLERLGEYTDAIERINIELSIRNKLELVEALDDVSVGRRHRVHSRRQGSQPTPRLAADGAGLERRGDALALLKGVRARWSYLLGAMDEPIERARPRLETVGVSVAEDAAGTLFERLQDRSIRVSWKSELRAGLAQIFGRRGARADPRRVRRRAPARSARTHFRRSAHARRRRQRPHQHSGEFGQLCDAQCRQPHGGEDHAHRTAIERRDLRRARHRHHQARAPHRGRARAVDASYKRRVDPHDRFNPLKLAPGSDLRRAYTPSFGLLGHESLIMQQSDISSISDAVKDCLRCGKCKPVCATHVPRANLLYSPRDKILATSLLIEAFLYEEQTRRGVAIQHWDELADVADHCTVCHRCAAPCPVDIDFGNVSMLLRDVLRRMGKKRLNLGATAALFFLNATNPQTIKLARKVMIEWGYKAQQLANRALKPLARAQTQRPPSTTGRPPVREQVIHFVNKRMPGGLPKRTARALLDIEDRNYVPIIRDPKATTSDSEAVFYFPGCGSERLFSQVGLATQAMLWHVGVQTVLPPGYLCCGYPQRGAGEFEKAEKIITDNRVLFHRVANTLNYLDIKTVVVSCGTCFDQLQGYEFDQIFPGCRIMDIHEYLLEKGVELEGVTGTRYMYHDPCHSPMKRHDPLTVVNTLMNSALNGSIEERALLRRIGNLGAHPARRVDAGALSQGAGGARRASSRSARAAIAARSRCSPRALPACKA